MSGSGQNDGGLMSSAGLVRYFESEDERTIRINPTSVLAVSLFISVLLIGLHAAFGV